MLIQLFLILQIINFDVLNNIADKEFVEAIYINKEIENEPNLINAKNFCRSYKKLL